MELNDIGIFLTVQLPPTFTVRQIWSADGDGNVYADEDDVDNNVTNTSSTGPKPDGRRCLAGWALAWLCWGCDEVRAGPVTE